MDTALWFWLISEDWNRFPASWREEIESAERVGVSPISCYEIVLAHKKGRLELPCTDDREYLESLNRDNVSGRFSNCPIDRRRSAFTA